MNRCRLQKWSPEWDWKFIQDANPIVRYTACTRRFACYNPHVFRFEHLPGDAMRNRRVLFTIKALRPAYDIEML